MNGVNAGRKKSRGVRWSATAPYSSSCARSKDKEEGGNAVRCCGNSSRGHERPSQIMPLFRRHDLRVGRGHEIPMSSSGCSCRNKQTPDGSNPTSVDECGCCRLRVRMGMRTVPLGKGDESARRENPVPCASQGHRIPRMRDSRAEFFEECAEGSKGHPPKWGMPH
jgi:hypothetical protein